MHYNWQQKDWTHFRYDIEKIEELLHQFSEKVGVSKGSINALSAEEQSHTLIDVLVAETIKSSEIEGEFLNRKDVVSSVKKNLGIGSNTIHIKDQNAHGMAKMVTGIRSSFINPLTETILFDWHKLIFPEKTKSTVGDWRKHTEPMQVVSGSYGKEIIHFDAPPSLRVPNEMKLFIAWFNNTAPNGSKEMKYAAVRSAIAHLYFESIHPFEDGNGRVGRGIAEKALLQSLNHPLLISLSVAIESDRKSYYQALKQGQSSNDVTEWLVYFLQIIIKALNYSEELLDFTLKKTKLFDKFIDQLNERQTKVLKRMMDEGPKGFDGGMTAKKYMVISKTSKATATRDIQQLKEHGIFRSKGGGRSTAYEIVL